MNTLLRTAALAGSLGMAAAIFATQASAWWGGGPWNGLGNGMGNGDMNFNMGGSGSGRGYNRGYGYGYGGAPYGGYPGYGAGGYPGYGAGGYPGAMSGAPYGYGNPWAIPPAPQGPQIKRK